MKITAKSATSEEKKEHSYLKQSSRRMSHQWGLSIDWFRTTGAVDGIECRRRSSRCRLRHSVPYTAPRRPSTALDAVHGTETTVYGTRCRIR
ncbi:hypothetical protein V3C99_011648, partial [Haemonchus contortus]